MTCHHLLAPLKMFPQPRVCAPPQFWLQLAIPPQLTTGKGNSWKKTAFPDFSFSDCGTVSNTLKG